MRITLISRKYCFCTLILLVAAAATADDDAGAPLKTTCAVYPAVPPGLDAASAEDCKASATGNIVTLENGFLAADISADSAVIMRIRNKLTGETTELNADVVGLEGAAADGARIGWLSGAEGQAQTLRYDLEGDGAARRVIFTRESAGCSAAIVYELKREHFWLERRIRLEGAQCQGAKLDNLVYGRLQTEGAAPEVLKLGKFDQPRLARTGRGGLFAGVGWWYYSVDAAGVYQNVGMKFPVESQGFLSEPWYAGIFRQEPGEPFAGWLWYKTFLELRKAGHDKHLSWSYWNAGWGQWGIEVDNNPLGPPATAYIDLMKRLGVRGICFGGGDHGKHVPEYVRLGRENQAAKDNLAVCAEAGIAAGVLDYLGTRCSCGFTFDWAERGAIENRLKDLDAAAAAGYRAFHFDFFGTGDTFPAHYNVARYFRACRGKLEYTECHLGMSGYGPQFQREVLINHPADVGGFPISRYFSPNWATFLSFRSSRAEWQRQYQYLMPECGLYYFLTQYSNWACPPKLYTEPEPQQFLYGPFCGVNFNFHDAIGFRSAIMAASAFSPYHVFGHIELKMPEADVAFARSGLEWVAANAGVLRRARVCVETGDVCVVSKIRDGKGAIYVLNYSPGARPVEMKLELGTGAAVALREVYPQRRETVSIPAGGVLALDVPGESLVVYDVNNGLLSLPPESPGVFPIDLKGWEEAQTDSPSAETSFWMPDVRAELEKRRDPALPRELVSYDTPEIWPHLDGATSGRLPERFREAHGFREGKLFVHPYDSRKCVDYVDTWKFVPWAFADRVWLVYSPKKIHLLDAALPGVEVNGRPVFLAPRVDYRDAKKPELWNCPLFFADITDAVNYGATNTVRLVNLAEMPSCCYITGAAVHPRQAE